jgi:hypothetical protein
MATTDLANDLRQLVQTKLNEVPGVDVNYVNVSGTQGSGINCVAGARRTEDRARLSVQVGRASNPEEAQQFWEEISAAKYTDTYLPFSGLPLGDSTRRNSTEGGVAIEATASRWYCRFQVAYGGSHNRESDKVLAEGMARNFLAAATGFEAAHIAGIAVAGTTVGCVTGSNGERLVDLVGYCDVLNLQLSTNTQLGTASFTWGGEMVVIPLAAKRIKDGSRWIGTQDISVIVDNRWYVSYAALEEARR